MRSECWYDGEKTSPQISNEHYYIEVKATVEETFHFGQECEGIYLCHVQNENENGLICMKKIDKEISTLYDRFEKWKGKHQYKWRFLSDKHSAIYNLMEV